MPDTPSQQASSGAQQGGGVPQIFDTDLQRARKRRALRAARRPKARDGGFLLDVACRDLGERLSAVERTFDAAVDASDDDGRTAQTVMDSGKVQMISRLVSGNAFADARFPTVLASSDRLPLAEQSLGLVTSLLALQWVNDLPGTLIQFRRALKPDGLFIGASIGGNTLHELRDVLAQEEEEATGGTSPRVAPFVDVRDFGSLLQRAGFALPVTDVDTYTVRYGNLFVLMADLRAMGATNTLVQRSRRPWTRQRAVRAAQIYAQKYADEDGRIRATFQIVSFSGWAPSESQQKPLRPGSAKARLADALDTQEFSTDEKATP